MYKFYLSHHKGLQPRVTAYQRTAFLLHDVEREYLIHNGNAGKYLKRDGTFTSISTVFDYRDFRLFTLREHDQCYEYELTTGTLVFACLEEVALYLQDNPDFKCNIIGCTLPTRTLYVRHPVNYNLMIVDQVEYAFTINYDVARLWATTQKGM